MAAPKGRPRAPRGSLSREAILDGAVSLLDERGPAALTMRSLAERLGVRPMALYTYFASKDQLLDAARDHILRDLDSRPAEGEWADRLRSVGLALYRLLVAHPALIHLFATRPLAGHEAAEAAEAHLRVLRDAGFDRATAARAHLTLLHHVLGSATWDVRLNVGRDAESRRRRRAALRAMSGAHYPTLVDLAPELVDEAAGEQQFLFGLEVILDGLAALRPRGAR
ncbi:MAG: TetR/AcrR family transcriptional regulator C-terminal domain-containing protein [Actinomycetota bacterium]|nr:TetR/AcrR family transcriptional regulator C-terminal domain-containing protein [Actinomycetota bacterium]